VVESEVSRSGSAPAPPSVLKHSLLRTRRPDAQNLSTFRHLPIDKHLSPISCTQRGEQFWFFAERGCSYTLKAWMISLAPRAGRKCFSLSLWKLKKSQSQKPSAEYLAVIYKIGSCPATHVQCPFVEMFWKRTSRGSLSVALSAGFHSSFCLRMFSVPLWRCSGSALAEALFLSPCLQAFIPHSA